MSEQSPQQTEAAKAQPVATDAPEALAPAPEPAADHEVTMATLEPEGPTVDPAPAEGTTSAADTASADSPVSADDTASAESPNPEDSPVPAGDPAPADPAPADSSVPAAPAPAAATPRPGPPNRPAPPSPAALAGLRARPSAPNTRGSSPTPSDSARFGRVDESGRVFVTDGEEEREVGSYPGASAAEALQYFARKYDELAGTAELLRSRLANPEVAAKEIADGLASLRDHLVEAKVVGDLAALRATVEHIESGLAAKREAEATARAEAKAAALKEREHLVSRSEQIAAQPPQSTQWKSSGEQMRALLEEWKRLQRSGPRLDKPVETELWQRFSQARNTFDRARRTWFAALDETRAAARSAKEALVAEAESLSTSTDWAATARAFKQLMDQWRRAGRANRGEDDRLWERFKTAQDAFFSAKDAAFAAQDAEFAGNLAVKEELLKEAEALLPITDLDAAKTALRGIQDRWDKAGKVPRGDMDRTERALRRVESAVREAEDKRWKATNPEVAARATSMVNQLEASLAGLRDDLAKARAKGNATKVAQLESKIAAQEQWLNSAQAGADEFGG